MADPKISGGSQGYVTSSCMSEALGRGVALGLVQSERARVGEKVYVYFDRRTWPAQIVSPRWYDPEGQRLNA